MMKRIASLLLVLLVLLTGAALAEDKAQVSLSVLDENGNAFVGAQVTVTDGQNETIEKFTYEGPVLITLAEGSYTLRAADPADGFAAAQVVYAEGSQACELVIRKLQEGTKAVVGTVSRPSGAFFTDMWGSNTSDIDVRALVHGLSTVAFTRDRQYAIDPTVVADVTATEDTQGNKTFTFTLNKNLRYSDGSSITAADYVFSVLFQSAKETAAIGANALTYAHLVGYEDYFSGKSSVFSGVRLLSSTRFSLTVDAENLPYFYELMYVNVTPYPISVIAPGCTVKDSGKGAYIDGGFTAELLEKTVLNEQTGYLSHPSVVSGPYILTSYDAQEGAATFVANPYYAGNYQGIKPVIEALELRKVQYDSAIEQLASGEIDVINKASEGAFIDEGVQHVGGGDFAAASYLRNGYGFLAFACEESATQSVKVRQAMAMCLDRSGLIEDYLKSYGMEVYSYYGLGQWVAQPYASTIQDEVTVYAYDTDAAVRLLEQDGWTLNAQGEAFAAGTDSVRYKKDTAGNLVPLEIRFAQLANNGAAQWIVENYAPVLREIGFSFEATEVTFDELLSHYYRQTERTYNLMFLATNFNAVFDPYYTFNTDAAYQGTLNTSGIADSKLMELAKQLRETAPTSEATYSKRWLEVMKRFSDVLPTLPIYSNIYYDFYANELQNYAPDAHWSWTSAILYAYFAD